MYISPCNWHFVCCWMRLINKNKNKKDVGGEEEREFDLWPVSLSSVSVATYSSSLVRLLIWTSDRNSWHRSNQNLMLRPAPCTRNKQLNLWTNKRSRSSDDEQTKQTVSEIIEFIDYLQNHTHSCCNPTPLWLAISRLWTAINLKQVGHRIKDVVFTLLLACQISLHSR